MMTALLWLLLAIAGAGALVWYRVSLQNATLLVAAFLAFYTVAGASSLVAFLSWALFLAVAIPLNIDGIRQQYLTRPAFELFRKVLPSMSDTEREALEAGTVGWDGELVQQRFRRQRTRMSTCEAVYGDESVHPRVASLECPPVFSNIVPHKSARGMHGVHHPAGVAERCYKESDPLLERHLNKPQHAIVVTTRAGLDEGVHSYRLAGERSD
jgi:hypothetical protein